MNNLMSRVFVLAATVLAVTVSTAAIARAETGCAEKGIRAVAESIPGMTVQNVVTTDAGVLITLKRDGAEGLVLVCMTAVGEDLVTFQGVMGRPGVSTVDGVEVEWLSKVFDQLTPDKSFLACKEIARPAAPTSEQAFTAMQNWWSEQHKKDQKYAGGDSTMIVVVAVVAVLLIIIFSVAVVVRRRKGRSSKDAEIKDESPAEGSAEDSAESQPPVEAAADEPGSEAASEDNEVL